jgi:hypothetical protein
LTCVAAGASAGAGPPAAEAGAEGVL